jgi:Methylmalonyl-CoA mutase, N-terminal domain/subunit
MEHQDNLFKEFDKVSAEAWLAKIKTDLKGKELTTLNHQIGTDIDLSPFHHADTMISESSGPISKNSEGNEWLIAEEFILQGDLKSTNLLILHALANGVQAIKIKIDWELKANDFAKLFKDVEPAYIHIHFMMAESIDPLKVLTEFNEILSSKKGALKAFNGSISGIEFPKPALQKWTKKYLPNFKIWCMDVPFDNPVDQLTKLVAKGVEGLAKSEDISIVDQVIFKVKIETDFFLEIAKLRALRVIWANVLKAYKLKPTSFPFLMVDFNHGSQTNDNNQNMIRATTMAMAAAIGGADLISVLSSNSNHKKSSKFECRIARNVQHILKMESFLNRVRDVSSGSYYVETLTIKIGESVWKNLSNE